MYLVFDLALQTVTFTVPILVSVTFADAVTSTATVSGDRYLADAEADFSKTLAEYSTPTGTEGLQADKYLTEAKNREFDHRLSPLLLTCLFQSTPRKYSKIFDLLILLNNSMM
jgi:hypothetical protein